MEHIDTLTTNIIGTCNLLEALRISGSRAVIHVCASSEVFGKIPSEQKPAEHSNQSVESIPHGASVSAANVVILAWNGIHGNQHIISSDSVSNIGVGTQRIHDHAGPVGILA